VPAELVTGLEIVANPALTQEEVKVTEIGTVADTPFSRTGMLRLLVPYAEIGDVSTASEPRVMVPPLTDMPA
jgi:hypothetical protein